MQTIDARGLSPARFDEIVTARTPTVLRGLGWEWPAVIEAGKGDEALVGYLMPRATPNEHEVLIAPSDAKGRFFYREDMAGVNFKTQHVPLRVFLEHLLFLRTQTDAPTLYIQSTSAPTIIPAFADENHNRFLAADVVPRLWIGNATRVATHFDVADNLAVVVAGKRRFTLFSPEQVKNLYVGPLDFTLAGQPISLADPDEPDFNRYPLFREALVHAQVAELNPGDAIYIPSPWWHAVAALSPINMLVNYWWRDYPSACGTPFNWLIHGLLSVRNLPAAERNAWRALMDHYVFDDNGDPAAHLPEAARSVLGPMTPDLAAHLRQWLGKQFS